MHITAYLNTLVDLINIINELDFIYMPDEIVPYII